MSCHEKSFTNYLAWHALCVVTQSGLKNPFLFDYTMIERICYSCLTTNHSFCFVSPIFFESTSQCLYCWQKMKNLAMLGILSSWWSNLEIIINSISFVSLFVDRKSWTQNFTKTSLTSWSAWLAFLYALDYLHGNNNDDSRNKNAINFMISRISSWYSSHGTPSFETNTKPSLWSSFLYWFLSCFHPAFFGDFISILDNINKNKHPLVMLWWTNCTHNLDTSTTKPHETSQKWRSAWCLRTELPPIKAQVGLAKGPDLTRVKSKIGSLENVKHKPGMHESLIMVIKILRKK